MMSRLKYKAILATLLFDNQANKSAKTQAIPRKIAAKITRGSTGTSISQQNPKKYGAVLDNLSFV
jgi:hypothetical protein